MQEVIEEIVEVLKRHGINVDLDSAIIEIGPGGDFVFKCKDLNREDWEEEYLKEMRNRMKIF